MELGRKVDKRPVPALVPGQARRRSATHGPNRYHRYVLGLLMMMVVGIVWVRRRWIVRRERVKQAEWARAEAEAVLREQEIIEDLEARFHE